MDKTDSARAHAERLARQDADEGTVVWAKTQNAGIGRDGKYWISGYQNLHCAMILRPEHPYAEYCQLSLLATICAALAISRQAQPMEALHFRWPNDVLLNGGKVAGICLSGKRLGDGVGWLVLALNVNVYDHPDSQGFTGASMRGEGFNSFDRVQVLEAYTREFLSGINRWAETGFGSLRSQWMMRSLDSSAPICLRWSEGEMAGVAKDLLEDGSLILYSQDNEHTVALGDFFASDFS